MANQSKTHRAFTEEIAAMKEQIRGFEEAKTKSKEFQGFLLDDVPMLICRYLPDCRIEYANKTYCAYFNKRLEELIGTSFLTLIPEEDHEAVKANIALLNNAMSTHSYEHQVILPDGELRWQRWTDRAIFDEQGRITAYQSIGEDVTDRKLSEASLRVSENNFHRSLAESPFGVRIVSPSGETLYVNSAFLDIFEYESVSEWKTPPFRRYTEKSRKEHKARKEHRRTGGAGQEEYELEILGKDGTLSHIQVWRKPVIWGGSEHFQVLYADITERKHSEELLLRVLDELQESQTRLQGLLDNSPLLITEVSREGRYKMVNRAVCNLYGMEEPEIIGKSFWELLSSRTAETFEENLAQVYDSRSVMVVEDSLTIGDAEKIYSTTLFPLLDEEGEVATIGSIGDEITDRKRTEEALRKSEENYRWLLNHTADVITVMDMNLRFTYVSPSIIRVRGYTVEEVMEHTLEQVLTPESLQIVASVFEEEMKLEASGTGDPDRTSILEVEQYKKDGSIVVVENHLSFLRNEEQKAVGIISVSHDITERKEAEDKIKKQSDAMESAIDGIAILNKDERYAYMNKAHARVYGYENAGELIGKSWRTLYDADEIQRFDAEIMPKFGQAGYWQGEALGMKKDGSAFPQEISLTALDGGELICVVGDITERKQAEELLRDSRELLFNALEMAHLGHWEFDVTNDLFTFNDQFYKIFRTTAEQVGGYTMSSTEYANRFVHPDNMDMVGEETRKAIETTDPHFNQQIEHRMLYADGEVGYLAVRFFIVKDSYGRTVKTYGVNQDITERKRSEEKLQHTLESLSKALNTTIQVLVSAVEARDPYTAGHQQRVADLSSAIAAEMGFTQNRVNGLHMAGVIHDIGKLSIPAEILAKPTNLTTIEFALVKEHSRSGYVMLKDVESPWPLAQIAYQHHERIDGSGYPQGLKGEEILMEARIMAVADVVESMASHRPYRPALEIDAALEEIEIKKGILYDDSVADACLKLFREKGYKLPSV